MAQLSFQQNFKMLYALGSNGCGQLGVGDKEDKTEATRCTFYLTDFENFDAITKITAGGNHTLIELPGRIYAAGERSDGRYPIVHIRTQDLPELSSQFRLAAVNSRFVAATWESTIIADDIDRIIVSGNGHRGELGLGQGVRGKETPEKLKPFASDQDDLLADISASMSHTVCLLESGKLWGWGGGRKGQLGQPAQDCWSPREFEGLPFEPHKTVCGKDFTVIAGAPSSGKLFVVGDDRWGVVSRAPSHISDWKDIGASWGSVFVLLDSGDLLSWGRDDHGQLGPKNLPLLSQIAVGSEHVVALTKDGRVIAWGWGEHGNCGLPIDAGGDVKGRFNELIIPDGSNVLSVGAGCATSFIATGTLNQ